MALIGNTDVTEAKFEELITTAINDSTDEAVQRDLTSTAGYIYTGKAAPGSLTSAAVWKICKIDTTTGATTWADGNNNYDNVYDDRTSLTYS